MAVATFVLIVAFPMVSGAAFGLIHAAAARGSTHAQVLARYDLVVYAVLLVPTVALAVGTGTVAWGDAFRGALVIEVAERVGWWVAAPVGVLLIVLGAFLGAGLYHAERRLWSVVRPRPAVGVGTDLQAAPRTAPSEDPFAAALADEVANRPSMLTEGRTVEVVNRALSLGLPVLVGTTLVTVVCEEMLWRAFLIEAGLGWGWSMGAVVAVSSLAFGLNHLYFGLQNAAAKAVEGAFWAGLFLTGGLLVAVASHLVFNLLAFNLRIEIVRR